MIHECVIHDCQSNAAFGSQVHGEYKEEAGVMPERPAEVDDAMAGQDVVAE
jgi:hypothetical protein